MKLKKFGVERVDILPFLVLMKGVFQQTPNSLYCLHFYLLYTICNYLQTTYFIKYLFMSPFITKYPLSPVSSDIILGCEDPLKDLSLFPIDSEISAVPRGQWVSGGQRAVGSLLTELDVKDKNSTGGVSIEFLGLVRPSLLNHP